MTLRPFIKILIAIVLTAMAAVVVIPNFVKARMEEEHIRTQPPANYRQCVDHNLPAIAKATQRWGIAKRKGLQATPTPEDLLPYLDGNRFPVCPAGGMYELGSTGSHPACSFPGHPWVRQ
jgi:hypothetical protein